MLEKIRTDSICKNQSFLIILVSPKQIIAVPKNSDCNNNDKKNVISDLNLKTPIHRVPPPHLEHQAQWIFSSHKSPLQSYNTNPPKKVR